MDAFPSYQRLPETTPARRAAFDKTAQSEREQELRRTAREFEAAFITEMLSHTGLEKALSSQSGFGGEVFSTMLVEKYASALADKGGFGLAEKIYNQLKDDI